MARIKLLNPHSKPLLFLPIETKVREYHGKLLLSLVAAERGFQVILGGQRNIRKIVHSFPRGTYIDKSVASTKKKWMKWCQKLGLTVVAWDEEGLVYFDDGIYRELRLCEEVLEETALFFTWGDAQSETILTHVPEEKERVIPVGNPRFDMMRPEIREFYSPAAIKLKERYGPILLINTNFGFCNHYHGMEAERKRLQTYPIAVSRPGFFDGWIEAQEKIFFHFKKMIPRLREAFPSHSIIIRPHPSEDHSTWNKIIENLPNCYVNGEGNVHEWIFASDVLVHFNCTTAIEAYLLGVPAIAFQPESIEEYEQKLPNALSLKAHDIDELVTLAAKAVSKDIDNFFFNQDLERTAIAKKFITGIDGPLASERIVEAILGNNILPVQEPTLGQKYQKMVRSLWLTAKRVKEGRREQDSYDYQKFPGLTQKEIHADIKQFQTILQRFSSVNVKPLQKNCFLIDQK